MPTGFSVNLSSGSSLFSIILILIFSFKSVIVSLEQCGDAPYNENWSNQKVVLWCFIPNNSPKISYKSQWFHIRSYEKQYSCSDSDKNSVCQKLKSKNSNNIFSNVKKLKDGFNFTLDVSLLPKNAGKFILVIYTDNMSNPIFQHSWPLAHKLVLPYGDTILPVRTFVGQTVHLECLIYGYPITNVTWKNNSQIITANDRCSFANKNGIIDSVLIIKYSQYYDANNYQCMVQQNSTQTTLIYTVPLYVFSNLAPLWPFIGIFAQFLLLFLIIGFVREPSRKGPNCEPLMFRLKKVAVTNSTDDICSELSTQSKKHV